MCHLHFPTSVCSVVLINGLEIKSVAQGPSAQKSFLKQIPELSTHPPCNWLPSAFCQIVFKQIKPKLGQGGDRSCSRHTQSAELLSHIAATDSGLFFFSSFLLLRKSSHGVSPKDSLKRHS